MRVGVDARTLVGDRSGVGYYLTNLIEHGAFDGHTLLAYHRSGGSKPALDVPDETTVRWRPVGVPTLVERAMGAATPLWWINVGVGRAVRDDDADAFFGPNFVQPATTGVPSAVVVHDLIHRTFPGAHPRAYRLYLRVSLRIALWRADHVVTVSEHSKQDLRRIHSVPDERVTVAHGAADDRYRQRTVDDGTRDRLREEYDLPDRFLLYVGTVEPRKNLSAVVEAIKTLSTEPPLVVVGPEEWTDEAFENVCRNGSARDRIHVPGYVPEADLPLLYNLATAFVFPSLYEGFGLPVLEAMQSGTPVVVSNRSSLPEVVGEAGLVVDPDDPGAFGAAIERLWTDPGAREEYARRGRDRARSFSWDRTASQVGGVLGRLGRSDP